MKITCKLRQNIVPPPLPWIRIQFSKRVFFIRLRNSHLWPFKFNYSPPNVKVDFSDGWREWTKKKSSFSSNRYIICKFFMFKYKIVGWLWLGEPWIAFFFIFEPKCNRLNWRQYMKVYHFWNGENPPKNIITLNF